MEPQGLTDGQKQRPWWAQISRWSAGRSSDQLLSFVNLSPLIIPRADKTSKAKGPLVIIRDHQLAASSGSKWLCRKWDAKICLRLFQGSHIRSVCLASLFLRPGPVWSCQPLRIRRFHRSTLKVHAPSSPKFGGEERQESAVSSNPPVLPRETAVVRRLEEKLREWRNSQASHIANENLVEGPSQGEKKSRKMWTFQTLTISTGKCKEQDSRSDLIGSALKSIGMNRITVHKFGTGSVPWRAVAEEIFSTGTRHDFQCVCASCYRIT